MALRISRVHYRQLLSWAENAHPLECCGLLLGEGHKVQSVFLARNVAQEPLIQFEIDPEQLIAAERQAREGGLGVIGYFHSHPNGALQPSMDDAKNAAADLRYWIVIAGGGSSCWQSLPKGDLHGRFTKVTLEIVDDREA